MPDFTVHDSGGVEIIVNHSPEWPVGEFWTFDPNPSFILGDATDGAAAATPDRRQVAPSGAIWQVRGAVRLLDGRIGVLSAGNRRLYLFEPSGKLSKTIGRAGQGPGEFYRPQHLQYLPPDTLVVWDELMGSHTRFDTAGAVLEVRTIDLGLAVERLPDQATLESRTIPLADGSVIVEVELENTNFQRPPDNARIRFPPVEFVRLDEAYNAVSLGAWAGREQWVVPASLGRTSPFADSYLAAGDYLYPTLLAPHVAAGGRPISVYVSSADENEIRQFSIDGTLVRIIRRATSPVAVTERAHRAWQENAIWVRSLTSSRGADWVRPLIEAMPKREFYPAIHSMLVDTEGRLWVREWSETESGAPDQWSVFSREGRWLGIIAQPPNAVRGPPDLTYCQSCWIGQDYFLTVRRDALGVEIVEAYRIQRND